MRLSVYCEKCSREVAVCEHGDVRMLETLILAAHAGEHTQPHRLIVRIDGKVPDDGDHDLRIRCMLPECGHMPREVSVRTPIALVNTHTISFHTHHEGHALEIELDGRRIHPA